MGNATDPPRHLGLFGSGGLLLARLFLLGSTLGSLVCFQPYGTGMAPFEQVKPAPKL